MSALIQPSFSKGEVNPELFGRVDTAAYKIGLATARNVIVKTQGGVINRPGLEFVGMQANMGAPSRLRRFRFNASDTYMLEFAEKKMRVIRDDAHVLEAAKTIIGASQTSPVVLTITGHGYVAGDDIEITAAGGSRLNGRRFRVGLVVSANTFTLLDIITGGDLDGTGFTTFTSGTAARVYTLATPYVQADLAHLGFVQSADILTITHPNYPEGKLTRTGDAAWQLTNPAFAPSIFPPSSVTAAANTTGSTAAKYVVTATDAATGEESLPSAVATISNASGVADNAISWTAVAGASQYSIYKALNGVYGFIGFTPDLSFTDKNTAPTLGVTPPAARNPFAVRPIQAVTVTNGGSGLTQAAIGYAVTTSTGSGFTGNPIVTNGVLTAFQVSYGGQNYTPGDSIAITLSGVANGTIVFSSNPVQDETITLNGFTWTFTALGVGRTYATVIQGSLSATLTQLVADLTGIGISFLNAAKYSADATTLTIVFNSPGPAGNAYGLAASAAAPSASTLTGGGVTGSGGATVSVTLGPASGVYPACSTYYQQRHVRAGGSLYPDRMYYSRTANFYNMSVSTPTQADDAITATLTSREVNAIRHMVPAKDLLVFTAGGEWRINSTGSGFAADTMEQLSQSTWGSSYLEPIVIGLTTLFVPENQISVRSFSYTYVSDAYQGTDLTLLSGHLFEQYPLVAWGFGRAPDPVIYGVRADGKATALTFQEEQQVAAWTRWDTLGSFEGVDVVRPNSVQPDEIPYFAVARTIAGRTVRYIERLHSRRFTDVRDCFFVDSGLSYDQPVAITGISTVNPVGIVAPGHSFVEGQQVDIFDVTWASVFDDNDTETQPDQLNGQRFTVTSVIPGTSFCLQGADGTAFLPYVSGGTARAPVFTVAGLDHLEGRTVCALADGNVVSTLTVSQGKVTLPFAASRIHVGLKYISDVQTLDLESPQGTIQGKFKRVANVTVRFNKSRGLFIGQNTDELIEIKQREFEDYSDPTALLSGDKIVILGSDWNESGRIFLRQRYPLPMEILAVIPELDIEG